MESAPGKRKCNIKSNSDLESDFEFPWNRNRNWNQTCAMAINAEQSSLDAMLKSNQIRFNSRRIHPVLCVVITKMTNTGIGAKCDTSSKHILIIQLTEILKLETELLSGISVVFHCGLPLPNRT